MTVRTPYSLVAAGPIIPDVLYVIEPRTGCRIVVEADRAVANGGRWTFVTTGDRTVYTFPVSDARRIETLQPSDMKHQEGSVR